jgi:tetratricopeptide (TPR) repeat protein
MPPFQSAIRNPQSAIVAAMSAICFFHLAPALADDTVVFATGKEGRGRSRIAGTILDYTGTELRIRQASGRESVVPAEKVVSIDTPKTPKHLAGDALFDAGDFTKAVDPYREAMREEKRLWMHRQILAQLVWCYRNLGQVERAGDIFLLLVDNDPSTQFFDAIPLAWTSAAPAPAAERQAKTWLAKSSQSAALLLGASWLLSTDRAVAIAALDRLAADADSRIAQLAAAQLWRTKLVTAKPDEVARWQADVEKLPAPLQAGPYYVAAEALARLGNHEQAALAYLRVPLLHSRHRYLNPDALFGAGRALETLGRPTEAAGVYRELTADYPTAPRVPEALRRLEALSAK